MLFYNYSKRVLYLKDMVAMTLFHSNGGNYPISCSDKYIYGMLTIRFLKVKKELNIYLLISKSKQLIVPVDPS